MNKTIFLLIATNLALSTCEYTETCAADEKCVALKKCGTTYQELLDGKLVTKALQLCKYVDQPYVCCKTDCETPNGVHGSCQPLTTCKALYESLQKSVVNPDVLEFSLDSYCDLYVEQPYVCCGVEDSYKTIPAVPDD